MDVRVRDDERTEAELAPNWSHVLPTIVILLLIFLSPLIFDLSRWLASHVGG